MMNAIDLFSGYGGISLALRDYARPLIYCEIEKYAQGILLSNFDKGILPFGPIWGDVTTLDGSQFKGLVDIVYGGFPCQDISVAGKGIGLEGKRSGLFREIIRICEEASPEFIFLENVPAIRTRGSIQVQEALASIGYASRWCHLSAAEVGANHKRERWFCLAFRSMGSSERINSDTCGERISNRESKSGQQRIQIESERFGENLAHPESFGIQGLRPNKFEESPPYEQERLSLREGENLSNADLSRLGRQADAGSKEDNERIRENYGWPMSPAVDRSWWQIEPDVGRVVDGCPERSHRIKALGNGVVPLQVKTAFETLIGIKL